MHQREQNGEGREPYWGDLRVKAVVSSPTTGAEGDDSDHAMLRDGRELRALLQKLTGRGPKTYAKLKKTYAGPHLRHLRTASPPEGLRIWPALSRGLSDFCSEER
jgi:hypothetical protein